MWLDATIVVCTIAVCSTVILVANADMLRGLAFALDKRYAVLRAMESADRLQLPSAERCPGCGGHDFRLITTIHDYWQTQPSPPPTTNFYRCFDCNQAACSDRDGMRLVE
jgi:hypothetical protein